MKKCPVCKKNKVNKYYLMCKTCIQDIVKVKINFSIHNITPNIGRIFPKPLINQLDKIVLEDIKENLRTLKNKTYTASITMSARIFEGFIRDYFDEDYFNEDEESDWIQTRNDNFQNEPYGQLFGEIYTIQPQLFILGGISEEDEPGPGFPTTLGGIIKKLNHYLPAEAVTEFNELRKIRNQAMHGKQRYSVDQALNYFKRVIKVLTLTYNGNMS